MSYWSVKVTYCGCINLQGNIVYFRRFETICYDDACHLLRYAQNPKRRTLTNTSERISNMEIVVDKFHFKNHVDSLCKTHCNPSKCRQLDQVSKCCHVIVQKDVSAFLRIYKNHCSVFSCKYISLSENPYQARIYSVRTVYYRCWLDKTGHDRVEVI